MQKTKVRTKKTIKLCVCLAVVLCTASTYGLPPGGGSIFVEPSLLSDNILACDWTGVWLTAGAGSGNVTLEQDGNEVSGRWPEPKKGGTLDGKIAARILTGEWRNPGTKTSGQFRFLISQDCDTFRGVWNITASGDPGIKPDEGARNGKLTRTWNGTRKSD